MPKIWEMMKWKFENRFESTISVSLAGLSHRERPHASGVFRPSTLAVCGNYVSLQLRQGAFVFLLTGFQQPAERFHRDDLGKLASAGHKSI